MSHFMHGIGPSIGENPSFPSQQWQKHTPLYFQVHPQFPSMHLEHNTRSYAPLSVNTDNSSWSEETTPRPCPAKGPLTYPAGLLLVWQQRASMEGSPPAPFPRIQHHIIPKSTNFQAATQGHLNLLLSLNRIMEVTSIRVPCCHPHNSWTAFPSAW